MPNYNKERDDLWALGVLGAVLWFAMGALITWNAFHPAHDGVWRGMAAIFGAALFYSYALRQRFAAWVCWVYFILFGALFLLVELANHL